MPRQGTQTVWQLRQKQAAGDELTPEERETLAAYFARYKDRRHSLYFESGEQKAEFAARAEDAGYKNFNAYLLELLKLAATGEVVDQEVITMLRQRIRDLEKREESAHQRAEDMRQQRDQAVQERDEAVSRKDAYSDALADVARLLGQRGVEIVIPDAVKKGGD